MNQLRHYQTVCKAALRNRLNSRYIESCRASFLPYQSQQILRRWKSYAPPKRSDSSGRNHEDRRESRESEKQNTADIHINITPHDTCIVDRTIIISPYHTIYLFVVYLPTIFLHVLYFTVLVRLRIG